MVCGQEVADGAALCGDGVFDDGGGVALGDAVEGQGQGVGGVVADFRGAGGVFVVEDFFGAEGFEEGVVVGRGGGEDSAAGSDD